MENRRVSSRFKSLSFEYKLSSSTSSDFRYKSILLPTVYVRLTILTTIRTEGYKSHSLLPYLLPRYPDRRTGLDYTLQTDYNHAFSSLQRGSLRRAHLCGGADLAANLRASLLLRSICPNSKGRPRLLFTLTQSCRSPFPRNRLCMDSQLR